MWTVGQRVFSRKGSEQHWYTGTVRHIDGERCYVIYDDGDDALLEADKLKAFDLHAGDQVFARLPTNKDFKPAKVVAWDEEKVWLHWAGGEDNWTSFGMIRLQPDSPAEMPVPEGDWKEGDRVFACWFDLFWYPGVVVSANGDQYHVLFDHGNQAMLGTDRIKPLEFAVGDKVFCRSKGGPEFGAGEITQCRGEVIDIRYEDGTEETTSIRLARLQRDEWFPACELKGVKAGDRILGCWFDGHWYPGVLLTIDGVRNHVLFDDGDQALITPDKLKPLKIDVGDKVYCRFKGGPAYYPGEVTRKQGEVIHINYDDGDEETTSIRLIRLQTDSSVDVGEQSA